MKHEDCIMPVYASLSNSYYCVYQWTSGSVNYHGNFVPTYQYPACGAYSDKSKKWRERVFRCDEDFHLARAYSLCEDKPTERRAQQDVSTQSVQLHSANISSSSGIRLVQCSSGHSIELFVSCEPRSECAPVSESTATSSRCPSTLFACETSRDHVSYTMVCNKRRDCLDGSDETFCAYESDDSLTYAICDTRKVFVRIHEADRLLMLLLSLLLLLLCCCLLPMQSSRLQAVCLHGSFLVSLMSSPFPCHGSEL